MFMLKPSESQQIDVIRTILLEKDRAELKRLENILEREDLLSERVSPIIEKELDAFEQHLPRTYHLAVEKIIERKLRASQDELLDVLYPLMGKMIRKYIAQQLQALKESVEQQVRQSFFGRLRAKVFGVRESDLIISEAIHSRVEEAYVIEQHSGILIGSASSQHTIDKELIAGMLTAIKAFVQDAFKRGEVSLEMINYGDYQIVIQDLYSYYIALAINGQLTAKEKQDMSKQMLNFAEKELMKKIDADDPAFHLYLKEKLHRYFIKPHS
jgi:hypothetical protein